MTGIVCQVHNYLTTVLKRKPADSPFMVFYITSAHFFFRNSGVRKFPENIFISFAEIIDQHIQPSAMGHTEKNFLARVTAGLVEQKIQHGNDNFRPFQGKTFLAQEFFVKKLFKSFGLKQFVENPYFFVRG